MNDIFKIRQLVVSDYKMGFFELLDTLTESPKPSFHDFVSYFDLLHTKSFQTWVVLNKEETMIIGSARMFLEPKYIHGLSYIAHIEDVVVHPTMRSRGVGRHLIQFLVNRVLQVPPLYKIILNCSDSTIPFYESCGFSNEGTQMVIRKTT
jgi:glucosamine-phosphate N-acetyltransferase